LKAWIPLYAHISYAVPLTQAQQRNAGKENVQEQNSGDQKQGKFSGAAVKGKGDGKQTKVAPPYKPTIQEVRSDSESEEEMAYILASAMKAQVMVERF
jgi:hypothetical protein